MGFMDFRAEAAQGSWIYSELLSSPVKVKFFPKGNNAASWDGCGCFPGMRF